MTIAEKVRSVLARKIAGTGNDEPSSVAVGVAVSEDRYLLVMPGNKLYVGFIVNSMFGTGDLSEFVTVKPAKKKLQIA